MPYTSPNDKTFVQAMWEGYNAPIQSQLLQEDLQLKKQEVVAQQMGLQNQMGLQQDMQKIWGPGGSSTASSAAADPSDPSQMPKLMATAASLFSHGQPQAGAQFLSSMSMLGYRQAETQKYNQQVQYRTFQTVGAALGAVRDQSSEDAAMVEIRAQGIDPSRYGITGDFAQDAPKLSALSQMAMSRAQQLAAQDREQSHGDLQTQRDITNGFASARLDQANKRLDIQGALADLRAHQVQHNGELADKKDARAQEGLHLRELQNEDRSYANASRLQKPEADAAIGIFGQDQRTSGLPPELQKSLALLAARRAKQQLYREMQQSGDSEYAPEDYATALSHEMDQMQRDGMFNVGDTGMFGSGPGYTFNPPKGAPAPQGKTTTSPAAAPKAEAHTMDKMKADPKVQDILNNSSLSDGEKAKRIHALGY